MAETPKNTLKQWFVTGAKPLQAQYWAWLDSYWHKSEAISINNIENLSEILVNKVDADQLALYAKKDASNIDVPTWKTKLGVGDLPPNVGTIDYITPGGEVMIGNAYKKVADPNNGKTYLLKIDGTAVDGDTFGKNIANSDLTLSSNRKIMGSSNGYNLTWDMPQIFSNPSFKMSPQDKRNDNTFNRFGGFNSNGEVGEVGYHAFYNSFQNLTRNQALNLAQLLNAGQGPVGAMDVYEIQPALTLNNRVGYEYVILKGINLNLDVTAALVELVDLNNNPVIVFNSNNIQLDNSGTKITIGYNFQGVAAGEYRFRISSGSKTLITNQNFSIAENRGEIDLGTITWDVVTDPSYDFNGRYEANGANLYVKPLSKNVATRSPIFSAKSSKLFNAEDDFIIDFSLNVVRQNSYISYIYTAIGLGTSSSQNSLMYKTLGAFRLLFDGGFSYTFDNFNPKVTFGSPNIVLCRIIKRGLNITCRALGSSNTFTLGSNSDFSFLVQVPDREKPAEGWEEDTIEIIRAFKIN